VRWEKPIQILAEKRGSLGGGHGHPTLKLLFLYNNYI
jgi:hypothetical protein